MERKFFAPAGADGRDVAARFLRAIKSGDAVAFWNLLDKKGQGYFIGMWFLALADADIRTIEGLAQEDSFLAGALRPIIEDLKENLGDLLDRPALGEAVFIDSQHARVPLSGAAGEEPAEPDYVPLVLELAPAGAAGAALTCWKVDTFRCIQFGKAT
ncbi:MAG: hypothetical protein K6T29_04675 [Peptococcaceae bacterium]|nr:hypothetical protein [Peptococcaceae bacterium]